MSVSSSFSSRPYYGDGVDDKASFYYVFIPESSFSGSLTCEPIFTLHCRSQPPLTVIFEIISEMEFASCFNSSRKTPEQSLAMTWV